MGLGSGVLLSGRTLQSAREMSNAVALGAFVQATILNPATGQLYVYNPLVITQGTTPAVALATQTPDERAALLARIEAHGWDHAASAAIAPSVAPSAGEAGMVPKPIVLRMSGVVKAIKSRIVTSS